MKNRIHISGGDPVSHLALRRGDPRAVAALLSSYGLRHELPRFPHSQFGGGLSAVVGVDMSSLSNGDGSPTKVEWLPLSGASGNDIAFGQTRDYELKPNKYARPGPLVMADTIAQNLVMTNLQVGGKPVFAGGGAVPCALFSHLCAMNALSSYVATNSAPITFTLQNIHASATQTVRGVWICDTQELAVG